MKKLNLLVVIFLVLVVFSGCNQGQKQDERESKIKTDSLIRLYEKIAFLETELKNCQEISQLKENLEDCKNKGKTEKTQKNFQSQSQKKSSKSSGSSAEKKEESVESTSLSRDQYSQTKNTKLASNEYRGDVVGDFGCSFNEDSQLFFYIRTSLINSVKNRDIDWTSLNSESGPKGQEVGEYTYYLTQTIILVDMLDEDWHWAIFLGHHKQYKYDMWVPHELIKLNQNLKNEDNIRENGLGGYEFICKINYHSI